MVSLPRVLVNGGLLSNQLSTTLCDQLKQSAKDFQLWLLNETNVTFCLTPVSPRCFLCQGYIPDSKYTQHWIHFCSQVRNNVCICILPLNV